jgi:hypothetical protein
MFVDIVSKWDKKNEKEFLVMLNKIGQDNVCVADSGIKKPLHDNKKGIEIIHIPFAKGCSDLGLVRLKDFKDVRRFVSSFSRKIVFGFENLPRKDSVVQRSSGMNRIICKEMNKRNNLYGLCLRDILSSKDSAVLLGRVVQNLYLCNKYGVGYVVFTLASSPYGLAGEKEIRSFMETISPNQGFAKQGVSALYGLLGFE